MKKNLSVFISLILFILAVMIPNFVLNTKADAGDFGGDADFGGDYDYDDYDYDYDYDNDNDSGNSKRSRSGEATPGSSVILLGVIVLIYIIYSVNKKQKQKRDKENDNNDPFGRAMGTSSLKPISEYLAEDPSFSVTAFNEKVSNTYIRLQNAWQKKDLEEIRPFLSDTLYAQFDRQLDYYRQNRYTNVVEKIAVLDVSISGWMKEANCDVMIVGVKTRITDYVINDENRTVIRGNPQSEKFMEYEWIMRRTSGMKTAVSRGTTAQNCPNCGAPIDINKTAKCPYCDSIITSEKYDWVLDSIKGISQRTVNH